MEADLADERPAGVGRFVPGVAALRTYRRRWLRSDLVAGIVLAAILVPQGMAYAELAGLPAVNGLYTTIACLVGYAFMGPSKSGARARLGPLTADLRRHHPWSSSPLNRPSTRARRDAGDPRRPHRDRPRWQLGFVADLLSKRGPGRLLERAGDHDHRRPAPKLCGFSTDADGFVEEVEAFLTNVDKRARPPWPWVWPRSPSSSCCRV